MRPLVWILFFGLLFSAPNIINAQNTDKEWVFVSKKNGYGRVLKSDQKVTVYWNSKRGLDVTWGSLVDITDDSRP